MKRLIAFLMALCLVTLLVVGCGSSAHGGQNITLHMDGATFLQSPLTIHKGESIALVDDVQVTHIIQNGSWESGVPRPATETGAPIVNVQFNGHDSHVIGPFTTTGTYHLYCIVHAGMNLIVIVS